MKRLIWATFAKMIQSARARSRSVYSASVILISLESLPPQNNHFSAGVLDASLSFDRAPGHLCASRRPPEYVLARLLICVIVRSTTRFRGESPFYFVFLSRSLIFGGSRHVKLFRRTVKFCADSVFILVLNDIHPFGGFW